MDCIGDLFCCGCSRRCGREVQGVCGLGDRSRPSRLDQAATSSRSGSGGDRRRALGCALEVEVREDPVEPARQPPVGPAEEAHRRRHEDHAHERGVEEHGDGEADAEQLAVRVVAEDEGAEHADHDQRGRGDHPCGARQAAHHGFVVVAGGDVLLADPGQEEHLVVHREPEEDGEHDQRQERVDRHRAVQPDERSSPQPHWNTATSTP